MTHAGVEFTYGTEVVGRFTDELPPINNGVYGYEPYRGLGHLHMQERLRDAAAVCSYVFRDVITTFKVVSCPSYGQLQLTSFETTPTE
jgi:hypothetical protein